MRFLVGPDFSEIAWQTDQTGEKTGWIERMAVYIISQRKKGIQIKIQNLKYMIAFLVIRYQNLKLYVIITIKTV